MCVDGVGMGTISWGRDGNGVVIYSPCQSIDFIV